MSSNNKVRRSVLLITLSIVMLCLAVIGYKFYISLAQRLPLTFQVPEEYKELFIPKVKHKINSSFTHNYKDRTAVSAFDIHSDYSVVVFKLPLVEDISLLKVIETVTKEARQIKGEVYENLNQKHYRLEQKSGRQIAASKICLILNGDHLKTIVKNDSIVSYALSFGNFSLGRNSEDDVDIYADCNKDEIRTYKPVPINLLFLKQKKAVYFVLLTNTSLSKELVDNTLFDLIQKK